MMIVAMIAIRATNAIHVKPAAHHAQAIAVPHVTATHAAIHVAKKIHAVPAEYHNGEYGSKVA